MIQYKYSVKNGLEVLRVVLDGYWSLSFSEVLG